MIHFDPLSFLRCVAEKQAREVKPGIFIALWAVGALAGPSCGFGGNLEPPDALRDPAPLAVCVPWRYAETLADACKSAGVPYWIAARMFERESGWRDTARNVNPNGTQDLGLAQLNTRYMADWERIAGGPVDPLNGHDSIRVGVRYLAALYRATGTWADAVAAYNCGLGRWRTGRIPASTRRHVAAIMGGSHD